MPVEIIAHRGASAEAPENTLAAVRRAWEQRADAVEIDVHQTRDGQLVAIHDATTRKTAGRNRLVRASTLAELKTLDVGRWKHRRWSGERVPTLGEVLEAVPCGKRLFVEIKCSCDCLPALVDAVRRGPLQARQVAPIGFDLSTMRLIKWALPESEVSWVVGFKRSWNGWTPHVDRIIRQAAEAGLDGIDAGLRGPVDARFVERAREAGLKVYMWTVDKLADAQRLIAAGVNGLTTNRPGWLREQLGL